jgi:thiamine-phosphate pyrophosphorylase
LALTYYITDRKQLAGDSVRQITVLKERVRAAFSAGIDYVQIREKDMPARELAGLVQALAELPEKRNCRLLVNDRLDIARSCGADGVHLPADSLPPSDVRRFVGNNFIIGVSCHNTEEVKRAGASGADYVLVAPVFDTASKPGMKPMGLAALGDICRDSPVPVLALGGVSTDNALSCVQAGCKGVAGIRLFQQHADLQELVQSLRRL